MIAPESYGIIVKTEPEQFRATIFDEYKGKLKAVFFGTASPGMIVRMRITETNHMPQIQLLEILAAPMALARNNIWWLHMILALIDTCVPLGSGAGPLYEQLLWLCLTDTALDKELQMRYCAKMIATLGLHTTVEPLCAACMHKLHRVGIDKLAALAFDISCASRLKAWINHSLKDHIGPSLELYMQHTYHEE